MCYSKSNPITFLAIALATILSWSGPADAQSDQEIPEAALKEPWNQQLTVLQSLSATITSANADVRSQLDNVLATLETALGEYERQVDRVIDRVVGDPQFAYVAAETSEALSAQLLDVHSGFAALYSMLGVEERTDVQAAQASLDALRKTLQAQVYFERDVVQALGSGSRQQIVGLATRWWYGEERAIAVRKFVAGLRQELQGMSSRQ